MRRKIANGEIPPEAYYKDQVRERETYISKGLIPPNERRPNNQPIMSRPPLLPNPPMYPQMRPPPSHFYRTWFKLVIGLLYKVGCIFPMVISSEFRTRQ